MTKNMMARALLGCGLAACLAASPAMAKIVKTALTECKTGRICFYWWPQLPSIPGWHTDMQVNYGNGDHGIYSLIPDGANFSESDVIIYAHAIYRQSLNPKNMSLDTFIANDQKQFRDEYPGDIVIAEAARLRTADGRELRSVTYFRPKAKNWERVAYGWEDDNYVLFVLNAHSAKSFKETQVTYEALVRAYKR